MAARKSSGSRKSSSRKSPGGRPVSAARKAAYGDIKQGIKHVEKAIGEVQKGLRKAEKAIEADAKARIREIRKEGRVQLAALKAKRKEAAQLMKSLSVAAEEGWQDVRQRAEQVFADAKTTANGVADRIRAALHG